MNFREERLTLQSQLSTIIKDFELQHLSGLQVSYLYIFDLCKNMCLLEVFKFGDIFTGLQMKIGHIVYVF